MYGTVYQLHYYVATMSTTLKGNLTVTLKIRDTNTLLASFPLQAAHFGGWVHWVELSWEQNYIADINEGLRHTKYTRDTMTTHQSTYWKW